MREIFARVVCIALICSCNFESERAAVRELMPPYPVADIAVANAKGPSPLEADTRPIIAVWREPQYGSDPKSCLRIAIWDDGSIVFDKNPNQWTNELLAGQVSKDSIASLKKKLSATGVFDQKERSYLVPDGTVECVMLSFDGREILLQWDEVESPSYGINIDPQPQHIAFKKRWYEINRLALSIVPMNAARVSTDFSVPKSWYVDHPLQSE